MDELFDTLGGLPVHPLVIHFVVVLVPLAAVGLIVAVANASFRKRFAVALVWLLAVSLPLAFVAKESGEALAERVGITERHEELGDSLPVWVAALLVVAVSWLLVSGRNGMDLVRKALGFLLVIASIAVTVMTFLVGHSGAEATWANLIGSSSSPSDSSSPTAAPTDSATDALTATVVSQHSSPDDCWTIIDGTVYDMTPFLERHPGGATAIEGLCGTDGTERFRGQHGSEGEPAMELESLVVGKIEGP